MSYTEVVVTVDLNSHPQWDELIRKVEEGETLRIVRGERDVALLQPAEQLAVDEAYLDYLAQLGLQQLGEMSPADEFADWKKPDGSR